MSNSQMYTATVIADSISPDWNRITTIRVVYPHAVHKDLLRHRCMNRNVESFRAQPPEQIILNLKQGHAFTPDVFAKRTKGMGQSAEQINDEAEARALWNAHLDHALKTAEHFLRMGVAKQQVNFVLQDFCPLTEIITATDWENFYALRCEVNVDGTPMARPEVYLTALAIKRAIEASTPNELEEGQLHLPMVTEHELMMLGAIQKAGHARERVMEEERFWMYVSAGRCARISYGDYEWWKENPHKTSYARAERLLRSGHMSPFEQQATPFSRDRWAMVHGLQQLIAMNPDLPVVEKMEMTRQLHYSGNLHGWVPARKTFPYEYDYSLIRELQRMDS